MALWLAGGSATVPLPAAPKGSAAFKQARKAELNNDYDKALELYQQALKADPGSQNYMLAVRRMRFAASQTHVDQGHRLLGQGKLEEAAVEFEKALKIDPASAIADQELRRTLDLIDKRARQKKSGAAEGKAEAAEPGLSPLLAAKKETEALLETVQPVPTLKPISTQLINLKASNDRKIIFETIGKLAGINVLFDPEMAARRVSVELNNTTLQQALDYVATISKSYWKPLSSNAIFVTEDNTQKRRDYEDYVVKTFYLSNVYTAQELQEIATAVRSVTEIRRAFTINSLNAIVVRATADQMALVEKVIDDIDKARGEVIVDVLVLETTKTRARQLGITPVSGGAPGINVPIGLTAINQPSAVTNVSSGGSTAGSTGTTTTPSPTTGGGTTAPGAAGSLLTFGKTAIVDFSLNLPSASVQALLSTSDTKVLQSPRVRGFDGYKASLRIGQRIPIATGSFQPGIGGVGINPLVNTQFNYQDVGVVLDLTPRINLGKEVSMHVSIEISNVVDHVDIGGISQPVIGQRKVEHDIRLREGESSIIGGLNQTQTTKTISGVPGLSSVPILKYLFSQENLQVSDQEILLVLTPHIVRVPEITDLNMKGIAAGTDQVIKLTYAPQADDRPALPPVPSPAAPAPAPPRPAPAGTPVPGAPPAPQGAQAPAALPNPQAAAPAAANTSENLVPRLRFDPVEASVSAATRLTFNLALDNATDLFAAPLHISYNPKLLRLLDVRKGDLLSKDGQDIIFSKTVQEDAGEISINLARFPGAGGVSGAGTLVTLEFQAVAPGKATVSVSNPSVRNAKLDTISLAPARAEVTVK
jgi:general secretion pathway protein D